jgi:hypothetical protein
MKLKFSLRNCRTEPNDARLGNIICKESSLVKRSVRSSSRPYRHRPRKAFKSHVIDILTTWKRSIAMWQDSSSSYGASSSHNAPPYYNQAPPNVVPLQFYAQDPNSPYPGSRPSLDGVHGSMASAPGAPAGPGYGGNIQPQGGFWSAFGTGGFEGEPPLLEGMY